MNEYQQYFESNYPKTLGQRGCTTIPTEEKAVSFMSEEKVVLLNKLNEIIFGNDLFLTQEVSDKYYQAKTNCFVGKKIEKEILRSGEEISISASDVVYYQEEVFVEQLDKKIENLNRLCFLEFQGQTVLENGYHRLLVLIKQEQFILQGKMLKIN